MRTSTSVGIAVNDSIARVSEGVERPAHEAGERAEHHADEHEDAEAPRPRPSAVRAPCTVAREDVAARCTSVPNGWPADERRQERVRRVGLRSGP